MESLAIYLDMDGVLSDFDHGHRQIMGQDDTDLNQSLKDIDPALMDLKLRLIDGIRKTLTTS